MQGDETERGDGRSSSEPAPPRIPPRLCSRAWSALGVLLAFPRYSVCRSHRELTGGEEIPFLCGMCLGGTDGGVNVACGGRPGLATWGAVVGEKGGACS